MIYFLYGPDTYRSRKKLREIIGAYQKKWGAVLGFVRLDAEEDDLSEQLPSSAATLFRQKTLLAVENALAAKKDYAKLLEARCPAWKNDADAFVIFWERGISEKRKKLAEFLKKHATQTQEFFVPDRAILRRLLSEEAKERGISLGRGAIEAFVGAGDSWAAVRELEKYEIMRLARRELTQTIIGQSVKPHHLLDAVLEGRRDALRLLFAMRKTSAMDDILLLGAFVKTVRGMLLLKSAKDSAGRGRVAEEEGMHSFVAKKLATQAARFSFDELKKTYQRLFAADMLAKTGTLPAESIVTRIVETGLRFDLASRIF